MVNELCQEEDLTNTNEGSDESLKHLLRICFSLAFFIVLHVALTVLLCFGSCIRFSGYVYLTDQLNEVKEEYEEKAESA